ncbi:MAG TPA: hypothetical protein VGB32_06455 [Candidatus Bathyarchaeia archaeon]|jgi:hypothetical protein
MADIYTWAVLILSTLTTFGLYMILSGVDNPWFAFAEHAFVGCAIGLSVVVSTDYIFRTIVPRIMTDPGKNWPTFISIALGLMMLLRIHKDTVHIARIPITIATGAGIAVGTRATLFSGIINQIRATILPVFSATDIWALIYNLTVILCVLLVFTYYFYTMEMKGPLKSANSVGKYILYLAFGVLFSQTYMGRLGLLLGHLENYLTPYFPDFFVTVTIVLIMIVSTYLLHKRYPDLLKKVTPE